MYPILNLLFPYLEVSQLSVKLFDKVDSSEMAVSQALVAPGALVLHRPVSREGQPSGVQVPKSEMSVVVPNPKQGWVHWEVLV